MNELRQVLREQYLLNVARLVLRSHSNGPGLRSVIWLQGCSIRCPGCINRDFLPFIKRRVVHPRDLLLQIRNSAPDIEGITVTGGEPFDQPEGLSVLLTEAQRVGLSTVVYTGYYLKTLHEQGNPLVERALENVDVLIDGPFRIQEQGDFLGRGSANQRISFLSDRYSASVLEDPLAWPHEEMLLTDGKLVRTGILKANVRIEEKAK